MSCIEPGDLVRIAGSPHEMLIIGSAEDDPIYVGELPAWFCAWDSGGRLLTEVFSENLLVLVRKEQRRIPRGGNLQFPRNDSTLEP